VCVICCLQSPPHLVGSDATLLRHPWEHNSEASQSSNVFPSSHNSLQWSNSYPVTTSVCQHQLNAETSEQQLQAGSHQVVLRPSSNLDSTVFHNLLDYDVYNPELGAMENPEYFHINSVLFTAHQLRTQRYGCSFFENWTALCLGTFCDMLFICIL